jgi:hypothetical protein
MESQRFHDGEGIGEDPRQGSALLARRPPPLVPEISLALGTESDPSDKKPEIDWDREVPTTDAMVELGRELLTVVLRGGSAWG